MHPLKVAATEPARTPKGPGLIHAQETIVRQAILALILSRKA